MKGPNGAVCCEETDLILTPLSPFLSALQDRDLRPEEMEGTVQRRLNPNPRSPVWFTDPFEPLESGEGFPSISKRLFCLLNVSDRAAGDQRRISIQRKRLFFTI